MKELMKSILRWFGHIKRMEKIRLLKWCVRICASCHLVSQQLSEKIGQDAEEVGRAVNEMNESMPGIREGAYLSG